MLYRNTLFISTNDLKNETSIFDNVEDKQLMFGIKMAHLVFLYEKLGTNLYKKIVDLVADNHINDAGNEYYKLLLDEFIIPVVTIQSLVEVTQNLSYKLTNKGTVQMTGENQVQIAPETLKEMLNDFNSKVMFLGKRLELQIIRYISEYPEYVNNAHIDEVPPTEPYSSNIWLGGSPLSGGRFQGSNIGNVNFNDGIPHRMQTEDDWGY